MKKERANFFLLAIFTIPLLLWGVYFFIEQENGENADFENITVEKPSYPRALDGSDKNFDFNAVAGISLYYGEKGEKILYENNIDKPLPIASISKLMTAVVVLNHYNLEEQMRVREEDVLSRTEFRDFRGWYETSIEEMIYPMLIESNNSAAFAFALISDRFLEQSAENSVESFVDKMNSTAKKIGLKKTSFVNPSGLDGRDGYNTSTAREIATFSRYIINENGLIFEILSLPNYRLYSPDKMIYYEAYNTNQFLHHTKNEWQELIIGGKTGWTHAAFGCLLLVMESPDKSGYIINVVLGAEDRFKEMEKIINYVYNSYDFY
jgi:serine-type D-Ala-D-Ala carboxypeptidase (penicillin-binding protein 5/6)